MRKDLRVPVIVVVAVAAALGGLLVGSALLPGLFGHSSAGKEEQGLFISGTETIKVLSPDGSVVSQWSGPDPLSNIGINALAACIPGSDGGSTNPEGPGASFPSGGPCSSFINGVAIVFSPASTTQQGGTCADNQGAQTEYGFSVTGCQATATATNTLTPLGCNPNTVSSGGACTGWITEATFGPTTFTPTNCVYTQSQTPCAITEVDAGTLATLNGYGHTEGFDYLNPTPIIVASGDSVLVTIQFTVS